MIIKKTFTLLKGVPNELNFSNSVLKTLDIPQGLEKVNTVLKLNQSKIQHFTKNKIFDIISDYSKSKIKPIRIVNLSDYILPVTYNKKSQQILINVSYFETDDISSIKPDHRNLYASIVYGICFDSLINGKVNITSNMAPPIISYLNTVLIRIFGKSYGLYSQYTYQLSKMKFILALYIFSSFFGETGSSLYRKSSSISSYNYKEIEDEIKGIDFMDITGLIEAFDKLKIMPGLTKHSFAKRIYSFLGVNFLPALEDLSRFISVITTSTVKGNSIASTGILSSYNKTEYIKIVEISKIIFRKY